MAEIKRITLHPLREDGSIDENINLYPKTLVDGIVDRNGNSIEVATKEELVAAQEELSGEIGEISGEVSGKQDELISG
jgi:hypothetical protein